jgi:DNA replication protein DnaC
MGWVLRDEGGRPMARRCACSIERQRSALIEAARIPLRYEKCTLQSFEVHNDSHKDALKIAKRFVKDYPAQDVGLLFIGPCGVGKTHLAVSVLRELVEKKGVPCLFYDFRELIRQIQATFTSESVLSESDVLAPIFRTDVLVLDELGAKRTTAWVEETVFYIINHRYNNRKMTLFTTNYPDSDEPEDKRDAFYKKESETLVDRIGVRLRSRIYEMCKVVGMEGDDYRKIAKQANYRF